MVGLVSALSFGARELFAQSPDSQADVVSASLAFVAPEGCGSREDLVARITRRSDRIRIEPEASTPRRLKVELASVAEVLVATLELEQPSGRRSSRTLRASTCDEALEAVALVAAVSLDPAASTAPEEALPPAPVAPVEAEPTPSGASSKARAEPPPVEPAEAQVFRFSAAVLGQLSWGPAPGAMPGLGFAVGVELETGNVFAPLLRAGFVHSERGGFEPESGVGKADFELNQALLSVCPVRFGPRVLAVSPCPFATVGRLHAVGSEALDAQTFSRPWWVLGGELLALARPFGPLELGLSGTAGIPLIRDTFQFAPGDPGQVVHRVPRVVFSASLSAGAVFP